MEEDLPVKVSLNSNSCVTSKANEEGPKNDRMPSAVSGFRIVAETFKLWDSWVINSLTFTMSFPYRYIWLLVHIGIPLLQAVILPTKLSFRYFPRLDERKLLGILAESFWGRGELRGSEDLEDGDG